MVIDTLIDLSHHNENVDFAAARQAGIVAAILKATEGATWRDVTLPVRRKAARDAGLLVGLYHYVSGVDVTKQLANFLDYAKPADDELVAIDFEDSSVGANMTLAQLETLVILMNDQLGRYPVVYGGALLREAIGNKTNALLSKCPLWYSRYATMPIGIPTKVWPSYTLWQYTDGEHGPEPRATAGIGPCDRNRFNGTTAELRKRWPL